MAMMTEIEFSENEKLLIIQAIDHLFSSGGIKANLEQTELLCRIARSAIAKVEALTRGENKGER